MLFQLSVRRGPLNLSLKKISVLLLISLLKTFPVQKPLRKFKTLSEHKELVQKLEFELLESEEISDFNTVTEFIKEVKKYGCTVGVDDFGAGYSNFNMLTNLDIDFVKIDGSLIKEIDNSKNQKNHR